MVSVGTEDDWATNDETGYENPYNYDTYDDDPTVEGDNPDAEYADAAETEPEWEPEPETEPGWEPEPETEAEPKTETEAEAEAEEIEPMYADVFGWVDGFFAQVIRRRINPEAGEGLAWDQRWWLYPEVVGRLTALHYAWEEARASEKLSAMSSWWIHHLEPHIRVIFDGQDGPMALAKDDGSWSGFPQMKAEAVPPLLRDAILSSGNETDSD
ncbi:UNVERIFIED_ORG: uncharacterized protein DUF4913 [Nocardia globerula]|uniref:Uncharacterized protein DUF4913 n=1 Tax=Nocardia globerula TaxID=1818 RepID=A0A652YIR8_NOCGL|nr:DUF4913 domain-containing protein [Nocardia globerula]